MLGMIADTGYCLHGKLLHIGGCKSKNMQFHERSRDKARFRAFLDSSSTFWIFEILFYPLNLDSQADLKKFRMMIKSPRCWLIWHLLFRWSTSGLNEVTNAASDSWMLWPRATTESRWPAANAFRELQVEKGSKQAGSRNKRSNTLQSLFQCMIQWLAGIW